jgi:glycosyltransferase involved in cell wall biosynthesis
MNNQAGVSVIICCYNSKDDIIPTLEHLLKQNIPPNINWEIILVDNNSTDDTAAIAQYFWKKLPHEITPLHIINEPCAGLSFARKTGINAAKYQYLILCDDDNWLSPMYVKRTFEIMRSNKTIGALGGWSEPAYHESIPQWITNMPRYFAIGKQQSKTGINNNYLYGAGLVIRKDAFLKMESTSFQFLLSDRKGKALSSGGDVELCFALRLLNYQLWYDDSLYFKHFISDNKKSYAYFLNLRKGIIKSEIILAAYRDIINNKKRNDLIYFLYLLLKLLTKTPLLILGSKNKEEVKLLLYHDYLRVFHYLRYKNARAIISLWKARIQ